MRFRKTLTVLILALALALELLVTQPLLAVQSPVRAQDVAPTLRSAPARVGSSLFRHGTVAASLPRHGLVAASLPRHGGVKPPLRIAGSTAGHTTAAGNGSGLAASPAKPFTQEQVSNMVRDGFGDDSGAKLIEQRGIDFAPSEDFIQTLNAAGASEAFLAALRAAKPSEPASARKPINQVQVFALLARQVPSHRVTMLVQERGIDFEPTDEYLQEVRLAGGEDELISALKGAKVTKPATVDPAAQARQAEVRQHVARGAELSEKRQYGEAEEEYRAALLLDSQNADLYVSLAYVLGQEQKWDDDAAAARAALRLNPDNDAAHVNLGLALGKKGDVNGEVAEYHEALCVNPNNDMAHNNLGAALGGKGDWRGEIAEEREALRLNPNNDAAHGSLGVALGSTGDSGGAIAELREALRLNSNNERAHANLGAGLGIKGDTDGAIAEYREALRLDHSDTSAHFNLGIALEKKGGLAQSRSSSSAASLIRAFPIRTARSSAQLHVFADKDPRSGKH